MKISIEKDQESSSQGVVVEQMRVDTRKEAKLFHMLSNTLYSNKPAAIIRELCSNAYDSHVMAGCRDREITIFAPTIETSELVIKDNGVGLTADEARRSILCYLGSNKDESDEFIGGWGIGSKSPFAYAKNYTVICVKSGRRAEFMCWKDDHGLPNSAIVSEDDTLDADGVEMRVPVNAQDVSRFERELMNYAHWTNYNVSITFAGGEVVKTRQCHAKIEYESHDIELRQADAGERAKIKLVYGGYSYNMHDVIDSDDDSEELLSKLYRLGMSNYDVLIVAKTPGSVTFNMNREEVEQTEKSKKFIRSAITKLLDVVDLRRATGLGERAEKEQIESLGELQTRISAVLRTESHEESVVSQAFEIFEETVRYVWKSQEIWALSRASSITPNRIYQTQFKFSSIVSQFAVFFSKNLRMDRHEVNAARNKSDAPHFFFIKASDIEEARSKISASPDFVGIDIDSIDFVEVKYVETAKTNSGSRRSSKLPPRPYCGVQKKFIKWLSGVTYVTSKDPVGDKASPEFIWAESAWRGLGEGDVKIFKASPEFIKKYVDNPQVYEFSQWIAKTKERANNRDNTHLLPYDKRRVAGAIGKLGDFDWHNIPTSLNSRVRDRYYELKDWFRDAERWTASRGVLEPTLASPHVRGVIDECHALIAEVFTVLKKTEFLNIVEIENAFSGRGRKKKYKSFESRARSLVASLKLDEYFGE